MMIHQIDSIGSSALRETRIRRALDCVNFFFLFKISLLCEQIGKGFRIEETLRIINEYLLD